MSNLLWLDTLPVFDGFPGISEPRRFFHDEASYDAYYQTIPDSRIGKGLIRLLQEQGSGDIQGAALEIGCGTGALSVGLVEDNLFSSVLLTDPSTAFLKITKEKLAKTSGENSKVRFAVLMAEEIEKLPPSEFSLIAMRSTLHHVSDIRGFFKGVQRALAPGGVFICEEPCMEGYVMMGTIAQFFPLIARKEWVRLNKRQKEQIQLFIDTMQFYARRDVDKSQAEDKHVFRVDEIFKIGEDAGLSGTFFPNSPFEYFAEVRSDSSSAHPFSDFFHDYLQFCMNFDPALLSLFNRHVRPYCERLDMLASHNNGPYMHGIFFLRKLDS